MTPSESERYLFDTSAVLAYWLDEPGAQAVDDLLQRASLGSVEALISFMTVFEAYYSTRRTGGQTRANEIHFYLHNSSFGIPIGLQDEILIDAGDLKVKYNLGVGDAWIAASAISVGATLVYKDRDFDAVSELAKLRVPQDTG